MVMWVHRAKELTNLWFASSSSSFASFRCPHQPLGRRQQFCGDLLGCRRALFAGLWLLTMSLLADRWSSGMFGWYGLESCVPCCRGIHHSVQCQTLCVGGGWFASISYNLKIFHCVPNAELRTHATVQLWLALMFILNTIIAYVARLNQPLYIFYIVLHLDGWPSFFPCQI